MSVQRKIIVPLSFLWKLGKIHCQFSGKIKPFHKSQPDQDQITQKNKRHSVVSGHTKNQEFYFLPFFFPSGSWHGCLEGHVWRGAWAPVTRWKEELDQLPEGRGCQLRRLLPLQGQHWPSQTGQCSAVKTVQVTSVTDKHGLCRVIRLDRLRTSLVVSYRVESTTSQLQPAQLLMPSSLTLAMSRESLWSTPTCGSSTTEHRPARTSVFPSKTTHIVALLSRN